MSGTAAVNTSHISPLAESTISALDLPATLFHGYYNHKFYNLWFAGFAHNQTTCQLLPDLRTR